MEQCGEERSEGRNYRDLFNIAIHKMEMGQRKYKKRLMRIE